MGEEVKAPTNTNDRVCGAPKLRYIDDELDASVRNESVLWLVVLMFFMTL